LKRRMKADKKAKEKAEKEAKQPQPAKTENASAKQKDDEEIDANVSYCLLYLITMNNQFEYYN